MERVRGIEPPSQAWEAYVLPLNHTRVARPDERTDRQSSERLASEATCYVSAPMAEPDPDFWPHTLSRVIAHQSLTTEEAAEVMRVIMSGEASSGQIGGFLMALRTKGETVDELEGLARTALGFASPVDAGTPVIDTCGTGGDRSGTFNISTIAAIVVAGAGVPVAKHGNRAASSHCGSADLLEALGVKIDLDAGGVQRCLTEAGIGFMFAPMFHPAAGNAAPVRSELRVPTVFNFLGPLTNPARPFAQVVGVSDERMLPLIAEVLARRGVRAKVFRGEDGLDELTTTGISMVFDVRDGDVREGHLDPAAFGLARATLDDLRGGNAAEGAAIARSLLAGEEGRRRDVVLLNAGAALEVAGKVPSLENGIRVAADSIDSGAAAQTLERWLAVSNA
jgi:anthranilate phosphoribosyltransferase